MTDRKSMTLGNRLRSLRHAAGLSVAELARAATLTENAIYRLEAGDRTQPRADTIEALSRALGVSADELLGLAPSPNFNAPPVAGGVGPLVKLRVLRSPADARGEPDQTMLVPEIILPADLPHDVLAVAPVHDDALAPDLHDGDLTVIALDHDWQDSDLIAVALDEETVAVRHGYHNDGEVLVVTGDPRETRHLPPTAVLGRVMRIIHSV